MEQRGREDSFFSPSSFPFHRKEKRKRKRVRK